jgi:hypothetical protein
MLVGMVSECDDAHDYRGLVLAVDSVVVGGKGKTAWVEGCCR